MKKNIIIYGLIAGLISCIGFIITMTTNSGGDMNFENGMIYGYASMLLAFALIFVGVKNYRDKYNAGSLTYGKAFMIGLYMTLIASTVYVGVWLIDYYCFIPDFGDKYAAHVLANMKAEGASQDTIDKKVAEMAQFKELYKNPLAVILFTYLEILPLGVIVCLIIAAILKRKPAAPAMA